MYAENDKISNRQLYLLMFLVIFGMTTIAVPQQLLEQYSKSSLPAIATGVVVTLLYVFFLEQSKVSMWKQKGIWYEFFLFLLYVECIFCGVWILSMAVDICREYFLPEASRSFFIITLCIVCGMAAYKGVECQGRMGECLLWFLIIPFLVLLFLAGREGHVTTLQLLETKNADIYFNGGYEVFLCFQWVTLGTVWISSIDKEKSYFKGAKLAIILNGLLCLILGIIAVCVFGKHGVGKQNWVVLHLMTTPETMGGILENLDILLVTIWMIALFFSLSSIFYAGRRTGVALFHKTKQKGWLIATVVMIGIFTMVLGDWREGYFFYMNYMKYIGMPLLLLVLLILRFKKPSKKAGIAMAVFLAMTLITGCVRGVELEDRAFLMTLGVDWDGEKICYYYDIPDTSDSQGATGQQTMVLRMKKVEELQEAFGKHSDKYLDCNHIKAIILGENILKEEEQLRDWFQYVKQSHLFADNIKVFISEKPEEIFQLSEKLPSLLGEYLENMFVDSNFFSEKDSVSLGRVLYYWENKEEGLEIPKLISQGERPVLEQTVLWNGKEEK